MGRKKPLSEQVVVVTGASAGLGRAIARLAGARGRFFNRSRSTTLWTSLRLRRWRLGTAVAGAGLATMGITSGHAKALVR